MCAVCTDVRGSRRRGAVQELPRCLAGVSPVSEIAEADAEAVALPEVQPRPSR